MLDERFWSKVEKTDGCWLWKATRRPDGYGLFWNIAAKRQERAHRAAFEDANGPIPTGLSLLHSCDNPPCVRPDHLSIGTQRDNLADMTAKGRRVMGERHPWHGQNQSGEANHAARLTAEKVADIRAMGLAGHQAPEIAARFGVHLGTIGYVLRGQTWQGVEPSAPLPPVKRADYRPKLGPDMARVIRASYTGKRGDLTRLAIQFGVSLPTVSAIIAGRSYPET